MEGYYQKCYNCEEIFCEDDLGKDEEGWICLECNDELYNIYDE